ncbi:bifunctional 2-polyprenyl-6-hydroxyphenol methylase/3-demethylubiquinol 3-O-methyltransferase UbiG [Neobacillus mesonae]|uniref:class I SAM-dependent methyltransferase n=1 Tax=Neobacillus mesonae TaxID=1193713 RepID=UPI0020404074|nr:class I SAM-dependent methyltransferase [Neobacillus mesonae]MCM3567632.1 class I SAM-dependent methyltransferase [Neobacillus mesonae]
MDDKTKWNSKYKKRLKEFTEPVPNARLLNLSHYLKGGKALDIACGLGGNSFFLAEKNYQVEAVDLSEAAIHYVQEQARKYQFQIDTKVCDLTKWNKLNWNPSSFDLVVMTYYLDRSLFPKVKDIVKENGYLFMETFYNSPKTVGKSVSSRYKLMSKELAAEFGDWTIHFFEENEQEGRQSIFCQKR